MHGLERGVSQSKMSVLNYLRIRYLLKNIKYIKKLHGFNAIGGSPIGTLSRSGSHAEIKYYLSKFFLILDWKLLQTY